MWAIRSRIILKIFATAIVLSVYMQSAKSQFIEEFLHNAGNIDDKILNFGFLLEVNKPFIGVDKRADFTNPNLPDYDLAGGDTLISIDPISKISFTVGFITSLHLTSNLDLRLTPRFSFLNRSLKYNYYKKDSDKERIILTKDIPSTLFELPLLLKYKGDRKKDLRPYVIGGVSYITELRKSRRYNDDELPLNSNDRYVKLKNSYFAWQIGLGIEIYNVYFKLTPEIRFSKSMTSVLANKNENKFTRPLNNLFDELIHLTFYFE